MARPLSELQQICKDLEGVNDAYIQAYTGTLVDPYIMIERGSSSDVSHADNIKYFLKKAYTLTVVDRAPDSAIPDLVEGLQHCRFDRFFKVNGLNHFVFQIFF